MRSREHISDTKSTRQKLVDNSAAPPMLRPHCGVWWDPSGRVEIMIRLDSQGSSYTHLVIEPPKDGSSPTVRGKGPDALGYISVADAARLLSCPRKTVYNMIEGKRLRREHGLRPWGKRWKLHRPTFQACVDRGDFSLCS